ncbi:MAG: hypothetical protein JW821_12855 [Deltaproteobacteria bacterium]|nr:hypothetical protein [Deltaproteobacteria bacterium]
MGRRKGDMQGTFPAEHGAGGEFLHQRLRGLLASILVMAVCFPLYYLGLFGSVEGPLNPAQMGSGLADAGVSLVHLQWASVLVFVAAVSWNWLFNGVCLLLGRRFTCVQRTTGAEGLCGAPVIRRISRNKGKDGPGKPYECSEGHRAREAHFHPVKKGAFAHTLWVLTLLFCVILFYHS